MAHSHVVLWALLPVACCKDAGFSKKWWSIGPFASGKTEYDGDPLVPFGGALAMFRRGPGSKSKQPREEVFTEHVVGARTKWSSIAAEPKDGYSAVTLPRDKVDWDNLAKSPPLANAQDMLHVQYWVVGTLTVKTPGRFVVDCPSLHTFELVHEGTGDEANSSAPNRTGVLAGNIYSASSAMGGAPVELDSGIYRLVTRVRGKAVPLQFSCGVRRLRSDFHLELGEHLPDVVRGRLLADESFLDVRLRYSGREWVTASAEVLARGGSSSSGKYRIAAAAGASTPQLGVTLAPGLALQLPIPLELEGPNKEREANTCVHLEVVLHSAGVMVARLPLSLRCRLSSQSALLTFRDVDGSVGSAAVLLPRPPAAARSEGGASAASAVPIVVSLSGVGVKPLGQADAYKMKEARAPESSDFVFGFEGLWVLAPHRGGPHNWEDVGMRTILRAIDVLVDSTALAGKRGANAAPPADPNRLVVHGHSRGGHGAWGLATRIPDRVLGVASACGWYSREEYGDANNLWIQETSLMHLDKQLLGILHASISENENNLYASNLRGMRALVRVASKDRAVNPWFGRRMARHLSEEGANVSLREFDQEHWWWDSLRTNDGGVMHDEEMRKWTLDAVAAAGTPELESLVSTGKDVTIAAGSPDFAGRFGIAVLLRVSPAARAFVRLRSRPHGPDTGAFELRSSNVLRLRLAAGSEARLLLGSNARIDGAVVDLPDSGDVELCRREEGVVAACSAEYATTASVPERSSSSKSATRSSSSCSSSSGSTGRVQHWRMCDDRTGPPPLPRSQSLLGPIRRVFGAPWVVVIPDDSPQLLQGLAIYFANGHLIAVGTATQVVRRSEASQLRATHRFVWLGLPWSFPEAVRREWPILATPAAGDSAELRGGAWSLEVEGCVFEESHAAVFLAPAAALDDGQGASESSVDLVVTATDMVALESLVSFGFATYLPHTRAPMSNMLPDFVVTGPEFRWKGYGGILAAGYWDPWWRLAPQGAYLQC